MIKFLTCLLIAFSYSTLLCGDFMRDMLIVDYWNRKLEDRLPVTYNHLLQGGYFSMPSARMGQQGEIGAGYALVPPYRLYNLRFQFDDRLEVTGSYRVFKGIEDPILSPLGFGDLSDKGANIKICIFHPEDSGYRLPGLSFGFEDFMGTRNFKANYIVFTQVLLDHNLELSLGYGTQRIRGFFGGVSWMPFRQSCYSFLQGLSLVAEYDAIPYEDPEIEKHPHGRRKRFPGNFGIKYRLWDQLDFSYSYIRGEAWAFSASAYYNLGCTEGLLPKIDDPLPYQAPVNLEPLGLRRSEDTLANELLYRLRHQGFDLLKVTLSFDSCQQSVLRLNVVNPTYYWERSVRERITELLARLIPTNIDRVIVVIETPEGFPIQEYHFCSEFLHMYRDQEICAYELAIVSPLREVSFPEPYSETILFEQPRDFWNLELLPKSNTFFGSATGKFKFALGLSLGINGFIYDDLFYSVRLGWVIFSQLGSLHCVDRLNPSQLPNVRTDIVRYLRKRGITFEEAYLQKNWNLGQGWYAKLALGYFEEEYGGVATELLYYPVNQHWAVGCEGAILPKRTPSGLGFTDEIRQYEGFVPTHHKFLGSQFFVDFYAEWVDACLDFKFKVGKFLANDYGIRNEITRYFPSGLRVSIWYTLTNGHDKINGRTYYDKGVSLSMPLDIFYTYTDRSRWGYGLSAWLRDVGVIAETGYKLYNMIREQRN